jgi:hypothetical protein
MGKTRVWSLVGGTLIGVAAGLFGLGFWERATEVARARFTPHPRLLPEADGALGRVLLHWVPALAPVVEETYQDFLAQLGGDVGVILVVPEPFTAEQRSQLDGFLARVDPSRGLGRRVRIVTVPGPITTWSKDRALVTAADSRGIRRLMVPAEPGGSWRERHNDWATVRSVADSSPDQWSLEITPFDFDAGDFAVGNGRLLVDSNLLEKNRHRGYSTMEQLVARLGEFFQMPVGGLGRAWGDTPRHHLSMYMTPLTGNTVLVGDPGMAEKLLPAGWRTGETSPETDAPLASDFSAATRERFERAARELGAQGFNVVRIPNLPFDDKTYLAYTNGVYELRSGRPIAYMPVYGVEALDRSAREVYEKLGWTVLPVRVARLYRYHGTIGCVVNVLDRR